MEGSRFSHISVTFKDNYGLTSTGDVIQQAKGLLAELYPDRKSKMGINSKTLNMATSDAIKHFKSDPDYKDLTKDMKEGGNLTAETVRALIAAVERKESKRVEVQSTELKPQSETPVHKPGTKEFQAIFQQVSVESKLVKTTPDTTISPGTEVRVAKWGAVVQIRPGIGVEVPDSMKGPEGERYVENVKNYMREIETTLAGKELLSKFDPRNSKYTQLSKEDGDSRNIYNGITVVIRPEPGQKGPIETGAFAARGDNGKPIGVGKDQIPLIYFPHVQEGKEIRHGSDSNEIILTPGGVTKHPDFPNAHQKPEQYDTILFHELSHAYLKQSKIFDNITSGYNQDSKVKPAFLKGTNVGGQISDLSENVEEQFVVGILAGKGLPFSENMYRLQKGLPLRESYKSVQIDFDPDLGSFNWQSTTKPLDVLKSNGMINLDPGSWIL